MNRDKLTYGEIKVRTTFNVNDNPKINVIKHGTAKLINEVCGIPGPELSNSDKFKPGSDASIDELSEIREREHEYRTLMQKAVEHYELAAMYAVKAITS